MADPAALIQTLKSCFGFDDFRPGQLPVVDAVLSGRHTLAVMPTGAGKSLCYQLPAVILPGTALVVSPLVALMKDQVDALRRRGVAADYLCATQSESDRQRCERALVQGRLRLVYVAPERFRSLTFLQALAQVRLSLVAVDEAHCVAEWGHAFRPDYEKLGEWLAELAPPRLLALTATASPELRDEIVRLLRLRSPRVAVGGFDRPNIHLEVHRLQTEAEKFDTLLAAVRAHQPAIVYAATRQRVESLASRLARQGVAAGGYHAGMAGADRARTQDRFQDGSLRVVVATNAFGLGVDKADVRLVLHVDLPRSLEAYYQEVGRAGRDGLPSIGALLFAVKDIFLQKYMVQAASPGPQAVRALWALMEGQGDPLSRLVLGQRWPNDLPTHELTSGLAFLESAGLVERTVPGRGLWLQLPNVPGRGEFSVVGDPRRLLGRDEGRAGERELLALLGCADRAALRRSLAQLQGAGLVVVRESPPESAWARLPGAVLGPAHLERLRLRRRRERGRLEQMIQLARQDSCRRRTVLEAFGERPGQGPCGGCDRCTGHRLVTHRSRRGMPARAASVVEAWTPAEPP